MLNDRRVFLGGSAAFVLAGCVERTPSITYSYRLRVTLQVGGAERTGEAVHKVQWLDQRNLKMSFGPAFASKAWAEAVLVDLGSGLPHVLATLRRWPRHDPDFVRDTVPNEYIDFASLEISAKWNTLQQLTNMRREVELPRSEWPLLVMLDNSAEPETVRSVDPDDGGLPFRVSGITTEICDLEPTTGLIKAFPWMLKRRRAITILAADASRYESIDNRLLPEDLRQVGRTI